MEFVIEIVAPVFGIVLLGYGATKVGWFSEDSAAGLSRFVFNFIIPAFLFKTFATRDLPDAIPWGLFGSYYLSTFAIYLIGMLIALWIFKRPFMGAVLTGMGCGFGNTVLLGLPLTIRALGDEGAIPVFLILSVHGLTIMTLTTVLLEVGRNANSALLSLPFNVGKGIVTNPLMMGLALGLVANFTGFQIPSVLDDMFIIMQGAVLPCALFAMGATLANYGFKGRLGQSLFVVVAKCLILPGLVFFTATYVFELNPVWAIAATLMAAQPTGVNVYLFAQRYGTAQAIASTSIFLSTAFSILSLTAILYFLDVS